MGETLEEERKRQKEEREAATRKYYQEYANHWDPAVKKPEIKSFGDINKIGSVLGDKFKGLELWARGQIIDQQQMYKHNDSVSSLYGQKDDFIDAATEAYVRSQTGAALPGDDNTMRSFKELKKYGDPKSIINSEWMVNRINADKKK